MISLLNKKVTLMGLGLHGGGLAVAKWLLRQGALVVVTDIKTKQQLKQPVQELQKTATDLACDNKLIFHLDGHQTEDFSQADLIIKNPGVPRNSEWLEIARENKIPIHNEASIFFSLCKIPIVGITGSKGKSTTTALLGHIFKKVYPQTLVAGNIKTTPMFSIIDKVGAGSKTPFVILELSSWQLEMLSVVKKSPTTALITNIKPEHLNAYDSINDYFEAKQEICKYQNKNENLVLNFDDERLRRFGQNLQQKVFWFSLKEKVSSGIFLEDGFLKWVEGEFTDNVLPVSKIKLSGEHNLENVMAAAVLAKIHKIPNEIIAAAVEEFSGLPGRLELVREFSGRKFYNDTTATAPVAAEAALKSFSDKVILIAGGTDKKSPLEDFARLIIERTKFLVLLPGSGTDRLVLLLQKKQYKNFKFAPDMPSALKQAFSFSKKGDSIILAPGFASFGLFLHEFDRGDQFIKSVLNLKND